MLILFLLLLSLFFIFTNCIEMAKSMNVQFEPDADLLQKYENYQEAISDVSNGKLFYCLKDLAWMTLELYVEEVPDPSFNKWQKWETWERPYAQ